jgi:hypothetical protein
MEDLENDLKMRGLRKSRSAVNFDRAPTLPSDGIVDHVHLDVTYA